MRWLLTGIALALLAAGAAGGVWYLHSLQAADAAAAVSYKTPQEKADVYVRFVMEAYDSIGQNYWQKATDAQLANLFELSVQKAGATTTATAADRASTAKLLFEVFGEQKTNDDKRKLAVSILQVALYNLAPTGRDELLSSEQQQEVQRTVQNVNPAANLYRDLGTASTSTPGQIREAYARKEAELAASSSPAAPQELAQAAYAEHVLSNSSDRARYDQTGAEPTVFARVLGTTLYLDIDKMSPQTAGDFDAALEAASTTVVSSLIIDLRGNIGGSLEQVPAMLGLFLGKNSYVFDLFHQGDFEPVRSPSGVLPGIGRYQEIAVLTDGMTQSSAEVLAAAFKRFHVGVVVGGKTRGWGSVELTYPLKTAIDPSTSYALLLVNALTLRDDNQPIEGAGVTPNISTNESGWQGKLPQYFRSGSLIAAVKDLAAQPPLK